MLSGGVDSSVAVSLLLEAGYKVTAFYLKVWLEDEVSFLGSCPWEEDIEFARKVCQKLSIPLEVVPFQQEYYNAIVSYVIKELNKGYTPSPDLLCNRLIKFGVFIDKIGKHFDGVGSGHYARLITDSTGMKRLYRAVDPVKDQSYFLSQMRLDQFQSLYFPVGAYNKSEVRKLAEAKGLPSTRRKDSQGICFLGKISYPEFVRAYLGERSGEIIQYETGRLLGNHQGHWFYTIGQRQGLGLGNGPWYVVEKQVFNNQVFVSKKISSASPCKVKISESNWLAELPYDCIGNAYVRIRHGDDPKPCELITENTQKFVVFDVPQPGIASGQFAVFYDASGVCLGSGRMERTADN